MIGTLLVKFPDVFRRKQFLFVIMMFLLPAGSGLVQANDVSTSLVGRWDFDDGTGKDLCRHGNNAVPGGGTIYSLGGGHSCIRFMPDSEPMRIPASEDSPLAIRSGTICFWLNTVTDRNTLVKYDNKAVEINAYRGDFQVRFAGEDDFRYWDLILDYDWPKYDMREWAFYGHPKASVDDSVWHLFAVAYDYQNASFRRGLRLSEQKDHRLA